MKWYECESCKFFGKTEEAAADHEKESNHKVYSCGMGVLR